MSITLHFYPADAAFRDNLASIRQENVRQRWTGQPFSVYFNNGRPARTANSVMVRPGGELLECDGYQMPLSEVERVSFRMPLGVSS